MSDSAGGDNRETPQEVSSQTDALRRLVTGPVIYALCDPARPDLVKIGKDTRWPYRLRQAYSHSPRPIEIVGLWPLTAIEPKQLGMIERDIHRLFSSVEDCDGREWFRADPESVIEMVSRKLERGSVVPEPRRIAPYDDWRDWVNPRNSRKQRRLWVGRERKTGRIKLVHSPHTDLFFNFCPTYNCLGLRWIEAWVVGDLEWLPSIGLNEPDRRIVCAWNELVERYGYGVDDPRVGWLKDGFDVDALSRELVTRGLTRVNPRSLAEGAVVGRFVQTAPDLDAA